jgi:isopenicillin N synthase-like dioxygenase
MTAERVPELSLAAWTAGTPGSRAAFSADLLRGLQRFGFVILKDHGVPTALLDRAYAMAERLFALPEAEKRRHCGGLRGYTPFGTEHAKNHRFPDLKEFWQLGREPARAPRAAVAPRGGPGVAVAGSADFVEENDAPLNVWPDAWPEFRETFTSLFDGLDETGRTLLEALAPGLGLPATYFDPLVRTGPSVLRLIHYPPVPPEADPNCVRSAAHEDINFLTILVAARGAGLELLDRDGCWLPVETEPRNLIVDSGDMLARLTNDVIPATTHRVVNPAGPNVSRYSMPFFMHPTDSTSLRCLPSCLGAGPRYPEITAGEFLAERLREIGLAK